MWWATLFPQNTAVTSETTVWWDNDETISRASISLDPDWLSHHVNYWSSVNLLWWFKFLKENIDQYPLAGFRLDQMSPLFHHIAWSWSKKPKTYKLCHVSVCQNVDPCTNMRSRADLSWWVMMKGTELVLSYHGRKALTAIHLGESLFLCWLCQQSLLLQMQYLPAAGASPLAAPA